MLNRTLMKKNQPLQLLNYFHDNQFQKSRETKRMATFGTFATIKHQIQMTSTDNNIFIVPSRAETCPVALA